MSDCIIKLEDIWSKYRIKFIESNKTIWEDIWAIKGISFQVFKGESIALIGDNGSGKTTLLKLISGLLKNEKGELDVNGSASALLEIGSGFHPDLTGRENIYLNASLFGLTKEQVNLKLDSIIEFSKLGRFINAPVKVYSQGMFVRLGFSIAIHLDPDILLIDDSLAVGDVSFQKKCIEKIEELSESGKTLMMVTHDIGLARRLSTRGLLLKDGKLTKDGSINDVTTFYAKTSGHKRGIASFSKDNSQVIFNNGRTIISQDQYPITTNSGLSYSFNVMDKELRPDFGQWNVIRCSDEIIHTQRELIDFGTHENLLIEQKNNNTFLFNLGIDLGKDVKLTNFNLRVFLSDLFKSFCINNLNSEISEDFFEVRISESSVVIFKTKPDDKFFVLKSNNELYGRIKQGGA